MRLFFAIVGLRARTVACALSAAGGLGTSSCHTPPVPHVSSPAPAVLLMENLAPYAWNVTAVSADRAPLQVNVPAGETVRWEVPAGTYEISQEALAGLAADEAVRRFIMPLTAGDTYRWRLVTLASVPAGNGP